MQSTRKHGEPSAWGSMGNRQPIDCCTSRERPRHREHRPPDRFVNVREEEQKGGGVKRRRRMSIWVLCHA